MTQRDEIRAHFDAGGSLTPLEALKLFGCFALSQRVGELGRSGYPIMRGWKNLKSGKRVRQYWKHQVLTTPPQQETP